MNRHATLVHHRAWRLILTVATGNEDALNAHPLNQRGLPTARRAPVPRWAMVPVL